MSTIIVTDEESTLAAVARNWWLVLFAGLVSIIIGIFAMVNPSAALSIVSGLFAIWLLFSGLFGVIRSFESGISAGLRALMIISGGLSLVLGFVALRSFFQGGEGLVADWLLAIFIGVGLLFRGISELMVGFEAKGQQGRGWLIAGGIILIIGGAVVISTPTSIIALAWIVGVWLVLAGIVEVIGAFVVRKAAA